MSILEYRFSAIPWQQSEFGGWVFVTIPKGMASEIRSIFKDKEEGWGRLKANASIGQTEWKTAIWFDTKANSYLLPLKAEIRKKEQIDIGRSVSIRIYI